MDGANGIADSKQNTSRFQVDKVDYVGENDNNSYDYVNDVFNVEDNQTTLNSLTQRSGNSTYDTHNVRSLCHYTREALPNVDHYRNVMSVHGHMIRPTLDELHHATLTGIGLEKNPYKHSKLGEEEAPVSEAVKFGWIKGVLIRCLLNIWGVMLFLRLSWVVGQAGIGLALVVVLLATVVTILTTLSMSAICTNGEVRGGGTYYMISRSLGPEFGGAIGLIFSLANAIAVAMYVVGFGETVRDVLQLQNLYIVDAGMNDVRIIGICTVIVLLGITLVGTEWETKAQIVLLFILLVAMFDFVIGSFIPPSVSQQARGFIGWNGKLARENFVPDFRGETFFSVFSIFFPAATGILAGANISGDLKDPQTSIPKGTFSAIIISSLSYMLFAVIAGCVTYRDTNGVETLVENGTLSLITNCSFGEDEICPFGLMNNYQVMEMVSGFGPLIYAGIFAATLSSALTSLVSAPKVFQALCRDKIFPKIEYFGKGFGKNGEPRRAYILAFAIALACVVIGELNAIAPIISNFFLAAYCLINFSCFHSSFVRSPGFRPAFKYYNKWVSLLAAILCVAVMFIINWWTALITYAIILALYIYIHHRKPDANWGSSTQAQTYKSALSSVIKLNRVEEHVKNYRPQILLLTGHPNSRPPLVDFTYGICKHLSLLVCGNIHRGSVTQRVRNALSKQAMCWLQERKIKGFYALVEEDDFSHGVRSLVQLVGLGKLRPNMLMMGYKHNWQVCDEKEVLEYFNVIHQVFDMHLSLGILRLQEGLDYSEYIDTEDLGLIEQNAIVAASSEPVVFEQNLSDGDFSRNMFRLSQGGISQDSSPPNTPASTRSGLQSCVSTNPEGEAVAASSSNLNSNQVVKGLSKDIPKDVLSNVNQFQRKQKKGTIDVWWLYDDGGLTMLIPYLLSNKSQWRNCKLRVFSLANKKDELDRDQRNMAALLNKFRIDYSDVTIIPDIVKPPQESSNREFFAMLSKWKNIENVEGSSLAISESEILAVKDKTRRHLRLRELLLQYSHDASLIVMTLPMPRKGTCSAPMYMAWLETLTRDMPPFLLLRGNQTSVLTFYS
ncbi:solute carrier family 12 member 2-like isoform X1 [Limulus polyphemus]|uniref:Solute carrier family 12 member 2-like isoform X1 n=2 Tax=Limulus polyphemus TaxID=6850 RepID=A0ABM1T1B2_LIMPO|nr:solute carrier family 12 member 2-like isoform X1 [Limulus polyphemus]